MKRILLIGLLAVLAISLTMAVPSYSRAQGDGARVGLSAGSPWARPSALQALLLLPAACLLLPSACICLSRPAYAYPPAYASQPAPAYVAPPQSQAAKPAKVSG